MVPVENLTRHFPSEKQVTIRGVSELSEIPRCHLLDRGFVKNLVSLGALNCSGEKKAQLKKNARRHSR